MDATTALSLLAAVTQIGFGAAAWRLATRIDKRQSTHEEVDAAFNKEVRTALHIKQPVEAK